MFDTKCLSDCCMVLSAMGGTFMLYLTVLFLADPERLKVVKHVNEEEDRHNYATACFSGFFATIIYFGIAGLLYYRNYGTKEKTEALLQAVQDYFKVQDKAQTYEQNQVMFNKSMEMDDVRKSDRL